MFAGEKKLRQMSNVQVKRQSVTVSTPSRLISLTQGRVAIVDPALFDYLSKWRWYTKMRCNTFYAVRFVHENGSTFLLPMHRQIMHCPPNRVVHHINKNGLDNRKANLLVCTEDQHRELHKFYDPLL